MRHILLYKRKLLKLDYGELGPVNGTRSKIAYYFKRPITISWKLINKNITSTIDRYDKAVLRQKHEPSNEYGFWVCPGRKIEICKTHEECIFEEFVITNRWDLYGRNEAPFLIYM